MSTPLCAHRSMALEFRIPIDVKSAQRTRYGAVHRCRDCGMLRLDPLPSKVEIPAFYDLDSYYTHGEDHIDPVEPSFAERLTCHLAWRTDRGRLFDPAELTGLRWTEGRMLDIGCGSGALLSCLEKPGVRTMGVDPDPKARRCAREKGHDVFAGTAEDLPAEIAATRHDLVTMTHVLEHCIDPLKALSNAGSVLSDTGLLYCEVPNAGSLYFETYREISEMLDVPRHLHFFRKSDLAALAAAAGLEIVTWRYCGLTRHFNARWKAWENRIFDRLQAEGFRPSCGKRSVSGDLRLLARGLLAPAERRYDCIGFLAQKARVPEPAPARFRPLGLVRSSSA